MNHLNFALIQQFGTFSGIFFQKNEFGEVTNKN